jgi:aspartyl-tRNA(Asn)/glutamyl-tRNA(Gln) amidotransferase subunit B
MEEGSLRCDANVSVRIRGAAEYGTKAEIKNMNSFRSVHRAIESEIDRQIAILEGGGRVIQETRGWDEAAGETHSMRSKEQAHDYRYFPDPDLVPLEIDRTTIERLRAEMPPLPYERFERYTTDFGIGIAQATQLVDNPPLAAFFDRVVAASNAPAAALNFVLGDLSRLANESGVGVADGKVSPGALAELIVLVESKKINSKIAKDVLNRLWADGGSANAIVETEGLAQVSDPGEVARFVDEVLAANAPSVASFKAGKENVLKFLVGQVMKASRGKANPVLVETLLREKLTSA